MPKAQISSQCTNVRQRVATYFHSVGRGLFIVLLAYGAKIKVVSCKDRVNVNKSPECLKWHT
jgi:hypothetical protein